MRVTINTTEKPFLYIDYIRSKINTIQNDLQNILSFDKTLRSGKIDILSKSVYACDIHISVPFLNLVLNNFNVKSIYDKFIYHQIGKKIDMSILAKLASEIHVMHSRVDLDNDCFQCTLHIRYNYNGDKKL